MSTILVPLLPHDEKFLNEFTPLFCGWTYDVQYGRVSTYGANTYWDRSRSDDIRSFIDYQNRFVDNEVIWIVRKGFPMSPARPSRSTKGEVWIPPFSPTYQCIKLHCDLNEALRMAEDSRPHW